MILEITIKEALTKAIGVKTITQNKKKREPKEIKNAKKIKQEKGKEYERAIREKTNDIEEEKPKVYGSPNNTNRRNQEK